MVAFRRGQVKVAKGSHSQQQTYTRTQPLVNMYVYMYVSQQSNCLYLGR